MNPDQPTVVCIASYEKGQAFLEELAAAGCNVVLLTAHKLKDCTSWPRTAIAEIHTFSDLPTPEEVLLLVRYLARHMKISRIVALDEFDLEAAALVREDMRLPGMGQSTTRHFRDKLAMRVRAQRMGIAVPEFIGVQNYDELRAFTESVPGPWLLKPRTSASAIGIRTINAKRDLWRTLDELGDQQSDFLLERYIPGDVFHVDSVSWQRDVLMQAVHGYGAPPMSLMQAGGVFTTRTLPRNAPETRQLKDMNDALLHALGMVSGATHSEYIRADEDGKFYFLETAARVGGAFIAELVQYSTGVNPWVEWARIEAAQALGTSYTLPPQVEAYAGSVICLAKQEQPDLSGFQDSEVVFHIKKRHHAGLIVQSPSAERVHQLVVEYEGRFQREFCTSLPAPDRPTS